MADLKLSNDTIRKAILGNNLLWRCTFVDEYVPTPRYDLTYTFGVDTKFMSCVQRMDIPKEDLDTEFEAIESFYKQRRKPVSWYLDPTNEIDLKDYLISKGLTEDKSLEEVWWVLDLENFDSTELSYTENLTIEECDTREKFEDHLAAAMRGYEDFKFWASLLSKSFRKPVDGINVKHYVAYMDGLPVACATLGVYFDIAFLINVAVVPEYRRKGIHTSMMLKRLENSKKLNCKLAFYQTDFDNEASIGTGKKVGFVEGFRRRLYAKES